MDVRCADCGAMYNDVHEWTTCPHQPFRDEETQARWEYGHKLLGNRVRMVNIPQSSAGQCYGLSFDGMIHVDNLPGAYPADMFEITGEVRAVPVLGKVS